RRWRPGSSCRWPAGACASSSGTSSSTPATPPSPATWPGPAPSASASTSTCWARRCWGRGRPPAGPSARSTCSGGRTSTTSPSRSPRSCPRPRRGTRRARSPGSAPGCARSTRRPASARPGRSGTSPWRSAATATSLVSQISPWAAPGTVARVVERLRPLCEAARERSPRAFVNLDMEEYRDLHLTLEVFTALLDEPDLRDLEAGIALQAYLPDSVDAFERLAAFATDRVARGGAGIKVRLVKGANLSMERVEAELRGWEQAPYGSKAEVDANYLRLLERALRPELAGRVRVGVASHNLYDVALAHLLARARGVTASMDVEMLQGMAPAQARAVGADVGGVLLYTPVVAPEDFDVAISYLVRRLEENAQPHNFLHALFTEGPSAVGDQEARFRASVAAMATVPTDRRRRSDRPPAPPRFANTTDSDPALPEVRAWAAERVAAPAP